MSIKINDLEVWLYKPNTYIQSYQSNPLQWMILKSINRDEFVPVTCKFKCRDFFNDVITSYHTKDSYKVYEFSIDKDKFNFDWDGLPVLLFNVCSQFRNNIEVINQILKDNNFPVLEPLHYEDSRWFLNIPSKYLYNTYFISAITLIIRCCNLDKPITWETLASENKDEGDKLKRLFTHPMWQMPESLLQYIWRMGSEDSMYLKHSEARDIDFPTVYMHNCGICSWQLDNQWKE